MKIKYLNSQAKEGTIQLKVFSSDETNQLNHYVALTLEKFNFDCAVIQVGIYDILRSKNISQRKDLPKKIWEKEQLVTVSTLIRYILGLNWSHEAASTAADDD